jgi:hypothetical protein
MSDSSGDRLGLNKAERIQTKAEQGPWNQSRVRAGSHQCQGGKDRCRTGPMEPKQSPNRLTSMSRRKRPMPNRAHGTKAESEQAHIEAKEMFDVAEVHYMCFGEFLFPSALVRPIE